jgi:hypothetical protein
MPWDSALPAKIRIHAARLKLENRTPYATPVEVPLESARHVTKRLAVARRSGALVIALDRMVVQNNKCSAVWRRSMPVVMSGPSDQLMIDKRVHT